MKIIVLILSLIVAYFFIKRNKKSRESIEKANQMVMCDKCGFHVIETKLCISKEQMNQCPNKK